jgi:hypothetical protein
MTGFFKDNFDGWLHLAWVFVDILYAGCIQRVNCHPGTVGLLILHFSPQHP